LVWKRPSLPKEKEETDGGERKGTVAPATTDLIKKIEVERAWARLESALSSVEWTNGFSRQLTRDLDEWRAEPEDG
jgi:hypothetical protein